MYKQTKIKSMAYILSAIFLGAALLLGMSQIAFAHGGEGDSQMMGLSSGGDTMMRNIEDQMVTDEVHEEMEGLMEKMMSGTIGEDETGRMVELMQDNQVVGNMMMGRMMNSSVEPGDNWTDMHNQKMTGFHSGGYMIIWWLFGILSFAFLILANMALLKWLKK